MITPGEEDLPNLWWIGHWSSRSLGTAGGKKNIDISFSLIWRHQGEDWFDRNNYFALRTSLIRTTIWYHRSGTAGWSLSSNDRMIRVNFSRASLIISLISIRLTTFARCIVSGRKECYFSACSQAPTITRPEKKRTTHARSAHTHTHTCRQKEASCLCTHSDEVDQHPSGMMSAYDLVSSSNVEIWRKCLCCWWRCSPKEANERERERRLDYYSGSESEVLTQCNCRGSRLSLSPSVIPLKWSK